MIIKGKYIFIWELKRCFDGNIEKLAQMAKDTGLAGFILKTHDGSDLWQQSQSIKEFKKAGLKIGTWGYCYGKNIDGEIAAIKKTVSLQPDFYVLDVESEFEPASMHNVAEQMLLKLKDLGIPLGYTSFAIPSYHTVPFEIFSKYCDFTMPQIYWKEMNWKVEKAFKTSYDEYSRFNLPIYPVGQITSNVPQKEIIEFNNLCSEKRISMTSYWSCQHATQTQLNGIKKSTNKEFQDAVNVLVNSGIIRSPEYWVNNALPGKTVEGEYARIMIQRTADILNGYKQEST